MGAPVGVEEEGGISGLLPLQNVWKLNSSPQLTNGLGDGVDDDEDVPGVRLIESPRAPWRQEHSQLLVKGERKKGRKKEILGFEEGDLEH